eukprot:57484-Prorocentrum_lima.AAC.1
MDAIQALREATGERTTLHAWFRFFLSNKLILHIYTENASLNAQIRERLLFWHEQDETQLHQS